MLRTVAHLGSRIVLTAAAFVVLAISITNQSPKWLSDFDQSFYLTIAYDLDRHGVFSNGVFDRTDSTRTAPVPGMFFGPAYPWLVLGAMKVDSRFGEAVRCNVESNHKQRDGATCEVYATPVHVMHALLLATGVLAIALAGALIFESQFVFWLGGVLAAASLLMEADQFSFIMTESLTFSLYSLMALFLVLACRTSRVRHFLLAGALLGLLCLTRPSFAVLIPVLLCLIVWNERWIVPEDGGSTWYRVLAFAAAVLAVLGPWAFRNHVSVGKWGLTEEYGSATLIERFAYNDMTVREFATAFLYCTPGIGDIFFDPVHGKDSMHRFAYHTDGSFFHAGRGRRDALVKQHVRLDPLIAGLALDEMREAWWRHILVSIPLAWCGMWVGWIWALALVPLFGWACVRAIRQPQLLFLLYATPPLVMLALHAAVANHYTRYNLILLGPLAVGAAWIISGWLPSARSRWRAGERAR